MFRAEGEDDDGDDGSDSDDDGGGLLEIITLYSHHWSLKWHMRQLLDEETLRCGVTKITIIMDHMDCRGVPCHDGSCNSKA